MITGFAADWHTPLTAADGVADADLTAAEARLGLRLPTAMREAYLLFGDRADLVRTHDTLLRPVDLHLDASGEVLVFRHENQHVAEWGVAVADLDQADPPVKWLVSRHDPGHEGWDPFLPRLSMAGVEMVLSESVMGDTDRNAYAELEDEDDTAALLARGFTRLAALRYDIDRSSPWYASPDVLLRHDGEAVTVFARTTQALARLTSDVPLEWEIGPL